ncbi:hypothetical protein PB1_02540 [Bacillus methanolicus PB1]|uniref:Uncharacterized protein n=1 Tax=Bacillus methanolicus PB1 TaxID=997296 RepID=I3E5L0_BACMT|nr:hypothetical protein [Bacillus methanolicus]EIJ81781.1 hypothetical protein PB1_02540 [Bacillus methanolicus PB1]
MKYFWYFCFLLSLMSGLLGVFAVFLDTLFFEEVIFTAMEVFQFIYLLALAALIKVYIFPKIRG